MDAATVIAQVLQALRMTALLAGPLLAGVLVVGLLIGIVQAATQVNESAVSFVPKVVVLFLLLTLVGPAMLKLADEYLRQVIEQIPAVAR